MDLKITRNNTSEPYDIELLNGRLVTVTGKEEIGNRILFGLSVYIGENPLNPNYGVDYYNNVFGRDSADTVVIDTLKAAILQTRGVTGIKSFQLTPVDSTRTATLTAQVQTTEGEIDLTTNIEL